ncbi:MAG: acyltransferase family protein [Terriglobia bacterium]|nr:acyltransferase family protein [Terriglobia bacterium]
MAASTSTAAVFKSTSIEYRPVIDGLRAIAVLAVILFHLNRHWLPGGFVGVDIFFVISGYLITSIIFRECEQGRFSFARFYQRRIARLLPSFFTVAIATVLAASFVYSQQDLASTGATLAAAAGSVANLKFMLQGNYFVISPDAQPFLHCWSLSVEEQFYLLFPAIFLLLFWKFKKDRTRVLTGLCGISLLFCIVLTHFRASWAFYLLPARAWELLAGSIFASPTRKRTGNTKLTAALPLIGLSLIALSFLVVSERQSFPGYLATLPVAGTACFLLPFETSTNLVERILSWYPLALVGRLSYSLYLWHWPVFSLVDYRFYSEPPLFRFTMKVAVTAIAAVACYVLVERPGRKFLNRPGKRGLAFAALGCSLAILIPLGLVIRNSNYVSATTKDVANGGLHFNQSAHSGSIILMGDSNASMYGEMMKHLASQLGLRLTILSVDGGDPLPFSPAPQSPLWQDSLNVVQKEKPDFVVFACLWTGQLNRDRARLGRAIQDLQQSAHYVILITQPPLLPRIANREEIRSGSRPPFMEDPTERAERTDVNRFVRGLQGVNVRVIDIESLFTGSAGTIRFTNDKGQQLYQDSDHLSGVGTNLVEPDLVKELRKCKPTL